MAEDRVRHILTDKRLSRIKSFLEKKNAIDCIFLPLSEQEMERCEGIYEKR